MNKNERLEKLKELEIRASRVYAQFSGRLRREEERQRAFLCPQCRGDGGPCIGCKGSGRVLPCPETDGDSRPCWQCEGKGYKPYKDYDIRLK